MGKAATRREHDFAARLIRRVILSDMPENWQTLVEQIAELEDLLSEGTAPDPDAHLGRAWIEQLLVAKRQRLRGIDVGL